MTRAFSLAACVAALLSLASVTSAQITYPQASGFVINQTNLTITPLPNGNNLWQTFNDATNTNAFAVPGVYQVVLGRLHNGTNAQWNNGADRWELNLPASGLSTSQATNAAIRILMSPPVTDLAIIPGFGVTPADSLDAFSLGDFAPGQTKSFIRAYEITPNVGSINTPNGLVYTAVPEPGSVALLVGMAGAGGMMLRRRRK